MYEWVPARPRSVKRTQTNTFFLVKIWLMSYLIIMRLLYLFLIIFFTSCGSYTTSATTGSVQKKKSERTLRAARLSNDDLLILEAHYPAVLRKILIQKPLNVKDVVILHEIGLQSEVLIHIIKYTKSVYMLTTDDIVTMQLGGVPFEVINFMIES
ncbi:MAG: hypothetical protein S4CHLAM20_06070 [Chlamydiia bacterium]|nr:hypothetical protein [Chlamydiia bacterium]